MTEAISWDDAKIMAAAAGPTPVFAVAGMRGSNRRTFGVESVRKVCQRIVLDARGRFRNLDDDEKALIVAVFLLAIMVVIIAVWL